jgi:hypothetical protein
MGTPKKPPDEERRAILAARLVTFAPSTKRDGAAAKSGGDREDSNGNGEDRANSIENERLYELDSEPE